jgi:putative oxidoreductase
MENRNIFPLFSMIGAADDVFVRPRCGPNFQETAMTTPASHAVWSARALGALRIVAGYLFIAHGTAKLFAAPHVAMFDGLQVFSLMGLAGVLELAGGAAIVLGLFTRPVAFVLSGFMAVAYFMAHASQGNAVLPLLNGGELAVLYSFLFLFLSASGGGAWSLDNLRSLRVARIDSPALAR